MTPGKFFITTPLYYVNDVPHIGHAYTTIAADVLARWHRLRGEEVFFLTGTDEHGSKIAEAAAKAGKEPQAFVDSVVIKFQELWKILNISHNDFIRTTEDRHVRVVQAVFQKLMEQGDIYKGEYEGWYCVPDESFWLESQLVDGKCPTCGRVVQKLKEESYFFKLSRYEKPLLDHLQKHQGQFVQPASRHNEVESFVRSGLKDLSISRTKEKWGIPVPGDPTHTVYVWFDALLNYIAAAGYSSKDFENKWPADVHLIGKEILRFHAIIWPAMLLALGIELPKKVFAHGWWTVEGQKMSKSLGNVVDPHQVVAEYGVDAFRYFLLREVPFGNDGDYSPLALKNRFNADLANNLGNLFSRTLNMVEKYCDGQAELSNDNTEWISSKQSLIENAMSCLEFHRALELIGEVVTECNLYIDKHAPWKLIKTEPAKVPQVLAHLLPVLGIIAWQIYPFMPASAQSMWKQLGFDTEICKMRMARPDQAFFPPFAPGQKIRRGDALFPRKV